MGAERPGFGKKWRKQQFKYMVGEGGLPALVTLRKCGREGKVRSLFFGGLPRVLSSVFRRIPSSHGNGPLCACHLGVLFILACIFLVRVYIILLCLEKARGSVFIRPDMPKFRKWMVEWLEHWHRNPACFRFDTLVAQVNSPSPPLNLPCCREWIPDSIDGWGR